MCSHVTFQKGWTVKLLSTHLTRQPRAFTVSFGSYAKASCRGRGRWQACRWRKRWKGIWRHRWREGWRRVTTSSSWFIWCSVWRQIQGRQLMGNVSMGRRQLRFGVTFCLWCMCCVGYRANFVFPTHVADAWFTVVFARRWWRHHITNAMERDWGNWCNILCLNWKENTTCLKHGLIRNNRFKITFCT